jgi:holo-[acyl-carrier protein] synthase
MIKGIGIDIIELKRIESLLENKKFINRVLTETEREHFEQLLLKRKIEFLAGRFAVKEAYAKARGTGIGKELSFQDIEVTKDERGKPIVKSNQEDEIVHVSISHSRDYAVAQIILESLSS